MSQPPVPISFTKKNDQLRKYRESKIPYPAQSWTEYYRWKGWLQKKLYSNPNGKSWKVHHQIDTWASAIYESCHLEDDNVQILMPYRDFRYFFSWWLFQSL